MATFSQGNFPEKALRIVNRAADKHPGDIDEAVDTAVKGLKKAKEWDGLADRLAVEAVRERIYDRRHTNNRHNKRKSGAYGGPAKVDVTEGRAVGDVYRCIYDWEFAGRSLGDVLVSDLPNIAESSRELAKGHEENAQFAMLVYNGVPKSKRLLPIRDAVSARKLLRIWRQVWPGEEEEKTEVA